MIFTIRSHGTKQFGDQQGFGKNIHIVFIDIGIRQINTYGWLVLYRYRKILCYTWNDTSLSNPPYVLHREDR